VERIQKKLCNTLNVSLPPLEYNGVDSFAGFLVQQFVLLFRKQFLLLFDTLKVYSY